MISNRPRSRAPRGLTIIDVMITLSVMAIVTAIALPALGPNDSLKLVSAATILASDLEYAQSESIASPSDPVLVRVDAAGDQYWLARASAPDTPIMRPLSSEADPSSDAYLTEYGDGRAIFLDGIEIELLGADGGSGDLQFDAFGRLDRLSNADIRLSNESDGLSVRISASTGAVSIVE